ncbi:MAG: GNAT family N-acetyltransferase [Actinomycetaceae bacterium]|nr:GNAT family N-acetyltransferase [Actinomycetaceae bacterium]
MDVFTRRLGPADRPDYEAAQRLAFGYEPILPPHFDLDAGSPLALGAFAGDRLLGKIAVYPLHLSLGGKNIRIHGVADVTVSLDFRGRGLGRQLFGEILNLERERGVVLSILYPSIPAVYRSYSYAAVASRCLVRLDPSTLARARMDKDIEVSLADEAQARVAYASLIEGLSGAVTPLTPRSENQVDVVLRRAGAAVAFIRMLRVGEHITCDLLLAKDKMAWESALGLLASETGGAVIEAWSTPHAPYWHWYPGNLDIRDWANPMMRVIDVVAALEGRGWAPEATGTWTFSVNDALVPDNSGQYLLSLSGGVAQVSRLEDASEALAQGSEDIGPIAIGDLSALVAGVRNPGDPQWGSLPDSLIRAASLGPWHFNQGF